MSKQVRNWVITLVSFAAVALVVFGIYRVSASKSTTDTIDKHKIVLGSVATDAEIWEHIAKTKEAKDLGLDIQVKELTDAVQLNKGVQDGSLDVNAVQSWSYFVQFNNATKDGKLAAIGTTYLEPMGVYSKTVKSIKNVPDGATVALSNSASQQSRALSLLAQAGLITLKKGFNNLSTVRAVATNPHHLKLETMDVTHGKRLLDDVDLVLLSNSEAGAAGYNVLKDSLYHEAVGKKNYDNVNILVAQQKNRNNATLKKLVKLYHEPAIRKWVKAKYEGTKVDVQVPISALPKD